MRIAAESRELPGTEPALDYIIEGLVNHVPMTNGIKRIITEKYSTYDSWTYRCYIFLGQPAGIKN